MADNPSLPSAKEGSDDPPAASPRSDLSLAGEMASLRRQIAELEGANLELRRAQKELARHAAQLSLIHQIGRQITTLQEPQRILEMAATLIQQKFNHHHVALFLIEEGVLVLKAVAGNYHPWFPSGHTQKLSEGINGWVASHGEKIVANDVSRDPRYISFLGQYSITRAELCLPLKMGGKTLGVLDIQSPHRHAFKESDILAMETLADQIAIALENARLYALSREELEKQKETAQIVRSLHRQLELILNAAGEGIFGLDMEGCVTFANAAAARMLGYHPDELIGRYSHSLWHHSRADGTPYPATQCPIYAAYKEGKIRQGDDEFFWRKNGSAFPVHYVSTPIREGGEIQGAVVLFADITETRVLEERLQHAQKMETIGRLTSGIAHDFNNLLTVILGHSEMLLSLPHLDEAARGEVEILQDAAIRAADLVRKLLTFSRQQVVQPEILNLKDVLQHLQELLRRILREDIRLHIHLSSDLPPVKMDPVQMDQIIMNLAINAIDAMPRGGELTIAAQQQRMDPPPLPDMPPGPYVVLTVSDTGMGMDAYTLSHCFEPFFTTKAREQGTGLGLSTVYGIVRQNEGYIRVESRPGQGTTFTIYLPPAPSPDASRRKRAASQTNRVEQATILLVEDEAHVREVIAHMLKKNYTVLEASSAQEAQQVCRQHPGDIDLLITDVIMAETSGPDMAQQLLQIEPDMEVLYISGHPYELFEEYAIDLKTNFLQKPFSKSTLLEKVGSLLEGKRGSEGVSEN
ncbi:MAG: PAS domain-containing protein [Caldilineae bacterium]|nr:MAG: PAS domain-containing protein [Caldilineae bacterium]